MPKSADFQKIHRRFIKLYGQKKGDDFYYAFINKKKLDDTKSYPGKSDKKERQCIVKGVEFKEIEGNFHVSGLIATTHLDSYKDRIPVVTLESFADQINSTRDARVMGVHHSEAEGIVYGEADVENTPAKVIQLTDGEYGLYVDTKLDKNNPSAEDIVRQWQSGSLDSFSITYDTEGSQTCDFEIEDDDVIRNIGPSTKLAGYTGATFPVNNKAVATSYGFKEFKEMLANKKQSEVIKMEEKKENEVPKEEPKEEVASAAEVKNDEAPIEEAKTEEAPKEEVASEEAKEQVKKKEIIAGFKAELKELKPDNKPLIHKGDKMETKERKLEQKEVELKEVFSEYKEAIIDNKSSLSEQWRVAARMEKEMKEKGLPLRADGEGFIGGDNFEIKENKIVLKNPRMEMKAAVTTDSDYQGAQTTFIAALANYEQTPSRYNDVYGPVIVNQLNDETMTWNRLTKENWSGYASIMFRARNGRNSTADTYSYGSTPGWDGSAAIKKYNINFVTSYVEVQAEDEAIEFGMGRGGIDVYAKEIEYGTKDLMTYLNASQIYGSGDGTAETESLGLDGGLIITSGNLYGKDVTSQTTLAAAGRDAMGSVPITLKKMREMIRKCVTNGARVNDLVFFTSYLQHDFIKALIQDMQRIVPTSGRVGFTGLIEIDGVPIMPEKDLDALSMTDDLFLIDVAHTKIAIKKAPTYVEFGKVSLHRRGIIWMMWQLYSDTPNHNYQINGLAIA